jgi:hypothetical protein
VPIGRRGLLVRLLHLPLPGPVLGLLLLMVALGWQRLRAPAGRPPMPLLQPPVAAVRAGGRGRDDAPGR